jgi:hypothetical protein
MKTSLLLVTSLAALALVASGCSSSDGSGTSGKRVQLDVKITGGPEMKQAFTNAQGWSIALSKVELSTGALYFYEGATIFSWAPPKKTPRDRAWEALGVRTAWAHPGHYVPGEARGEMLTATSVDLKAGDAALGAGDGVSGLTRSATFTFQSPPTGPQAASLAGHVAVVEGTATKGGETRVFRAEIDAADVANTKGAPQVEGCPFAEADMQRDGTVTLAVKAPLWFDQVEFDSVPKSADGKPVLVPATSIARNQLVRGMKAGDAYAFSYAPR